MDLNNAKTLEGGKIVSVAPVYGDVNTMYLEKFHITVQVGDDTKVISVPVERFIWKEDEPKI